MIMSFHLTQSISVKGHAQNTTQTSEMFLLYSLETKGVFIGLQLPEMYKSGVLQWVGGFVG
jgi:hypothetical protein